MSNVNITPAELQDMINRLRQWSEQMKSMRSSMQSYSSHLRSTWRDPQYETYVSKVGTLAKTMEANSDDLSHTAKTLELLKNNLERAQREYNTMINQRPR